MALPWRPAPGQAPEGHRRSGIPGPGTAQIRDAPRTEEPTMTLTVSAIQDTHAALPHFQAALDPTALFQAVPVSMPGEARNHGSVILDSGVLRRLRTARLMSQQDLADECWRRNIRVSIATIKRAEAGHAVRYRVARELARCFDVPVADIMRPRDLAASPQPLVA